MILLLGATSYIGQGFARALRRRRESFIPLSRNAFDYTCFEYLLDYVRTVKPAFLINAGSYLDVPDRDGEADRMELLHVNTLLPQTIARACSITNLPWAHVSSGGIYRGAKLLADGELRIERNLAHPSVRRLFQAHPERFRGFTEFDEPNSSFRNGPCTFCHGTQALAEEALRDLSGNYIWRFGLPFNELDQPANLLSQLLRSPGLNNTINSLSHLEECVDACLELWERRAPFGIYNVSNPGTVTTQEAVQMMQRRLKLPRSIKYSVNGHFSNHNEAAVPHTACILEVSKLLSTGIVLRNVKRALEQSIENWHKATPEDTKIFPKVLQAQNWP